MNTVYEINLITFKNIIMFNSEIIKQNKTKQNKTKQNKTKQNSSPAASGGF